MPLQHCRQLGAHQRRLALGAEVAILATQDTPVRLHQAGPVDLDPRLVGPGPAIGACLPPPESGICPAGGALPLATFLAGLLLEASGAPLRFGLEAPWPLPWPLWAAHGFCAGRHFQLGPLTVTTPLTSCSAGCVELARWTLHLSSSAASCCSLGRSVRCGRAWTTAPAAAAWSLGTGCSRVDHPEAVWHGHSWQHGQLVTRLLELGVVLFTAACCDASSCACLAGRLALHPHP